MSIAAFKCLRVALLALACHAPGAFAQTSSGAVERLHADALDSFRQARFPEAYGRFIALADAGHAPAANLALWMYMHGAALFGSEWDSTPEQLSAWAKLAGQPAPTMVASVYPQACVQVANIAR